MAARLQESRAEAGVVAAPRTDTGATVPEDRPRGQLDRTALRAERPRGRDRLAACRLALSERDFSD